ncbi:unnamed protein product [Durusdinium trenchii]|uniref:Uncharacterized protein n=1 Tax=Durusdinium trenchii TaxID=1381693 RepID=A0ABP0I3P6_9DINO
MLRSRKTSLPPQAGSTWKAEGSWLEAPEIPVFAAMASTLIAMASNYFFAAFRHRVNLLDCLKEWGDELNAWTSSPSSRSFYLFGPADVGERIWNERRFDHCARLTTGDPAQKKATYQGVHHLCRFQGLILEAKPSKNIDSWVIQRPTDRVGLAPNLRCSRCFFSRTKS